MKSVKEHNVYVHVGIKTEEDKCNCENVWINRSVGIYVHDNVYEFLRIRHVEF